MSREAKAIEQLAEKMIVRACAGARGIDEGKVMGLGQYRRLDCDLRALAYVRARPRKGAVRIDISGLWFTPPELVRSKLIEPSAVGICLLVRNEEQVQEAARFLVRVVEHTREQAARARLSAEEAQS